jgi:hypothetical protein
MAINDVSTPGMLPLTNSAKLPRPDRQTYLELAKRLLGSCPPKEGGDPEIFITAIVSILMHYPVAVCEEVVDPFFGLPAKLKFPPTPYDVRQACDAIAGHRHRIAQPRLGRMTISRQAPPPDPAPDPVTGRHPPGTILTNFDEATRLYGKPLERGTPPQQREKPTRPLSQDPGPRNAHQRPP